MESRFFVLIVDNVVQGGFEVKSGSESAIIKEVSGLNDIPAGTRFNPDTQSFYSNLEDKPSSETDSSNI